MNERLIEEMRKENAFLREEITRIATALASPPPAVPESVRRLSDAASKGKWCPDEWEAHVEDGGPSEVVCDGIAVLCGDEPDSIARCNGPDARFVCAAVNWIRALIAATPSARADTPSAGGGAVDVRRDIDGARELLARVWEGGPGTHELRRDIAAWLSNDGGRQVDAILAAAPEPAAGGGREIELLRSEVKRLEQARQREKALAHGRWTEARLQAQEWRDFAEKTLATTKSLLSAPPESETAGEIVRHLKRGTEYEVLGEAEAQVSTGQTDGWGTSRRLRDGDRLTVYRDPIAGKLWCRFTDEMRDGRFETVQAPAAPEPAAGGGREIDGLLKRMRAASGSEGEGGDCSCHVAGGSDAWQLHDRFCAYRLLREAADALEDRSILSASSEAETAGGDGWKLVPVTPTDEMLGAPLAPSSSITSARFESRRDLRPLIYAAMIGAAPATAGAEGGQGHGR